MFWFADPEDSQPLRLAHNLRKLDNYWQEWDVGIGGRSPAKLWKDGSSSPDASKYSRRKPIYLFLDRFIAF